MGRWFRQFFSEAGHNVLVSGRRTELSSNDIAKRCDVVILSLPLDAAVSLSKEIGPLLSRDQLLMDFCSLKERIVDSMLSATSAQVVGAHPLFGPFTDSIKGRNMIVCPGRGDGWLDRLEGEFQAEGAVVTRMDPAAHDKKMAVVQGLTHLLTICTGRTLQKMEMSLDEAILYSTPVFRTNIDLIGRLFAQDLSLYADLIGKNRYVKGVVETFLSAVDEGKSSLLSGKNEDADLFLKDIRSFLGDSCQDGFKESNRILNALYEELKRD